MREGKGGGNGGMGVDPTKFWRKSTPLLIRLVYVDVIPGWRLESFYQKSLIQLQALLLVVFRFEI